MDYLHAVILGVVEGITEFLPISSTGHLILAADLLGLEDTDFLKTFEIVIQLGAILSVVFLYWKRLFSSWALLSKVAAAFLPTALIGFAAYPLVKGFLLGSTSVVLWSLLAGGLAIILFERWLKIDRQPTHSLEQLSYWQAAGIGLAQAVSIVPGVSRAAATILGGMLFGLERRAIVEFSFLLAIPTMAAASGWDLFQSAGSFTGGQLGLLAAGFAVSFLTALAAVKWLLRYIQTHDFTRFGFYRIILALAFWLAIS